MKDGREERLRGREGRKVERDKRLKGSKGRKVGREGKIKGKVYIRMGRNFGREGGWREVREGWLEGRGRLKVRYTDAKELWKGGRLKGRVGRKV